MSPFYQHNVFMINSEAVLGVRGA